MAIITISRQFGSGGDEIAYRLSQQLGYRIFDRHMIDEAARASGLSDQFLDEYILDYSEDNYRARSFLDRVFESMPVFPYGGIWPNDLAIEYSQEVTQLREEESLRLVQKAIRYACAVGNIVIVGRGGQVVLKDEPGVIHVRIIAPLEDRIQRVREQMKQTEPVSTAQAETAAPAPIKERIEQRDAASADYLQRFYHVHWDDALLYDLVLNTGKVSIPQALQEILNLLQPSK